MLERRAPAEEFRLHGAAAAHVRDAIVVSTAGTLGCGPTILYVNAAFTRMTGYSEPDVLGQSFSVLAGAMSSRAALQAIFARFRRGAASCLELVAYRRDGRPFLLEWHASPILEADGRVEHFVSIQRDITQERSDRQALRRAGRDALTGLPTREALEKRIQHSIDRAGERPDYRFAVLFLDMDGCKAVNDEHGHVVGDQLLASAARRLEGAIRPGDALARFGGDEFVMLLHDVVEIRVVTLVADRVQGRMAEPFEIQGRSLRVAASIGVALSNAAHGGPEDVIRDADTAMYEAKGRGPGRIAFFAGDSGSPVEPTPD
jgi:diguanylate cyclase (GGDEF)-like protein/PAS domain S-box-containing protein